MSHGEPWKTGSNPTVESLSPPRNDLVNNATENDDNADERPIKKARLNESDYSMNGSIIDGSITRRKGITPVKAEYAAMHNPIEKASDGERLTCQINI
jgi:hypothetical protein